MNENTDEWLSCGAPCDVPRVWRCNETSHERLLLLVDCTESKEIGKLSIMESFAYSGTPPHLLIYTATLFDPTESPVFHYKKTLLMRQLVNNTVNGHILKSQHVQSL